MIDATLDEGFQNTLRLLRWFGREHLRPAGIVSDRSGKPLPEDSPLFRTFGDLGLRFGMSRSRRAGDTDDKPKGPSRSARLT